MPPEINIDDPDELWDTGGLGRDDEHVRRSTPEREKQIESSLGLQMISVRLPKELIEQLKFIAQFHSIGYQPLMRDVLGRWARTEILSIAQQMKQQLEATKALAASVVPKKKRA